MKKKLISQICDVTNMQGAILLSCDFYHYIFIRQIYIF